MKRKKQENCSKRKEPSSESLVFDEFSSKKRRNTRSEGVLKETKVWGQCISSFALQISAGPLVVARQKLLNRTFANENLDKIPWDSRASKSTVAQGITFKG